MAKLFAWHADRVDLSLASIRYRMMEPMAALQRMGVTIEPYDAAKGAAAYDAIIFCKSHGRDAVEIARAARTAGRSVILDNCDNVFSANVMGHFSDERLARTCEMAALATAMTFSTATLAEQFATELPDMTPVREIIPDTLDAEPKTDAMLSASDRRQIDRVRKFLNARVDSLHLIWFGKSLGSSSGIAHLDGAMRRLARIHRQHPVTLTIVSNSRWRYLRHRPSWRIPCQYIPWRLSTFDPVMRLHDVAIVPVESNEYTLGKTINRPATAVLAGLGVIADAIPAYEPLRPFIALDDWEGGIARYAAARGRPDPLIEQAQTMLRAVHGTDAVARRWLSLLNADA